MVSEQSLQDRYAPENACFGCGPSNAKGLRIKSFPRGDEVVAEFRPERWHEAFENILCGGIIGTLLDCHMNWFRGRADVCGTHAGHALNAPVFGLRR